MCGFTVLCDDPYFILTPMVANDEVVDDDEVLIVLVAGAELGEAVLHVRQLPPDARGVQQVASYRIRVHDHIVQGRDVNVRSSVSCDGWVGVQAMREVERHGQVLRALRQG